MAFDAVALVEFFLEFLPRVRLALFHAERDAAAFRVDFEDHDIDFLANGDEFARVDVFVGPVHFGDVYQAFHAVFYFDEGAVVGDVGDFAAGLAVDRVTLGDVAPRVGAELFQAEGDAGAFAVEFEDFDFHFVADVDDFGGVFDAFPRHVGDVEQAVHAADVEEGAVVGEVFDHGLDDVAFLQVFQYFVALGLVFVFEYGAAGDDDVVAFLVEFDDFEVDFFAFAECRVFDRAHVNQ